MTTPNGRADADRAERRASAVWLLVCGAMLLAAAGLVAAVFLGAPLVSIFLAGLLLLCPLLMWAPVRYQARSFDALRPGRRQR